MELREYLATIARDYRRLDGLNTPTQQLLKRADRELLGYAPGGIRIHSGGGKGMATYTPWIGFFDPDETTDPQEGIYVVYLFAEDLMTLTLTLNQGMEHLRKSLGDAPARARLAADAERIRLALPPHSLNSLDETIDLSSRGARQRAYQAGNIVGMQYATSSLPDDAVLAADLDRFLNLYSQAIDAKRTLLLASPGSIGSPSGTAPPAAVDPLRGFKPKDESDYVASLSGRTLLKSRRHEALLREYVEWTSAQGFTPASEHPADLVLRRGSDEWLVEAKVIYLENATEAVRAALGQLLAYRHFLYSTNTKMVGLFTEPIGSAYETFLISCGVESVWRDGGRWIGSHQLVVAGLSEGTS